MTGEEIRSIDGGPVDVWTLAFSPDSQVVQDTLFRTLSHVVLTPQFIATGSHNGKINLFSLSEGRKTTALDTRGKFIMSVTYVRESHDSHMTL